MTTIGSSHPVPTQPEDGIRQHIPKLDKRIFGRLQEVGRGVDGARGMMSDTTQLLNERPVWMRYSLLAQFSDADRYEIER